MAKEISDFRQGDTKKLKIDYGDNIDITGYKHWFTLRSIFEGPIIAQAISVVGDHANDEPTNGKAFIELGSDSTKVVSAGKYFWDVQRLIPNTTPPDIFTLAPSIKNAKVKVTVLAQVTVADV